MSFNAIIVGYHGQDGTLLAQSLRERGYSIVGVSRRSVIEADGSESVPVSLEDGAGIASLVARVAPTEIYYLPAYHHSAEESTGGEAEHWDASFAVHVRGLIHYLEAVRLRSPQTKFFYAASSHVFGVRPSGENVVNEETPFRPICIYGTTKTAGLHVCRQYRRTHKLFVSVGILFNHESPLRPTRFLSRKVVQAAWAIKRGERDELVLGDLDAAVDWGAAIDTVDAMSRILHTDEADDYVVATGELHTVRDFVQIAFEELGLDGRRLVRQEPGLLRKESRCLVGDSSKLLRVTGWRPRRTFSQMVVELVNAEGASHRR